MIGSFLYLTTSRPDIMHTICMISRFQSAPKQSHLNVVNQIFKYIKGTLYFGLWYPYNNDFTLLAYIDVDWGGSKDKKGTTSVTLFLGNQSVAWHSKKQECVNLCICESKFLATTTCCTQLIWMYYHFSDLGIQVPKPITIVCDNMSTIQLSKNLVLHCRTKHGYVQDYGQPNYALKWK